MIASLLVSSKNDTDFHVKKLDKIVRRSPVYKGHVQRSVRRPQNVFADEIYFFAPSHIGDQLMADILKRYSRLSFSPTRTRWNRPAYKAVISPTIHLFVL